MWGKHLNVMQQIYFRQCSWIPLVEELFNNGFTTETKDLDTSKQQMLVWVKHVCKITKTAYRKHIFYVCL